jgi:hypothetical protein
MTLDDRGRQAADDARAAAATTDFAALRARVGAEGYGDPGRRRRSMTLVAAAVLLVVGLGIGVLLAGHLHLTTTTRSASNASTAARGKVGAPADARHTGGGEPQALTKQSEGSHIFDVTFDRRLVGAPTSGLFEGDLVRLRGYGFPPGTFVWAEECTSDILVPNPDYFLRFPPCDGALSDSYRVPPSGLVEVAFRVERLMRSAKIDCGERPGRCVLVLRTDDLKHAGAVALTFAPSASRGTTTTAP